MAFSLTSLEEMDVSLHLLSLLSGSLEEMDVCMHLLSLSCLDLNFFKWSEAHVGSVES